MNTRFTRSRPFCLCALALTIPTLAGAHTWQDADDKTTLATTAEQIEIMRLVFTNAINTRLTDLQREQLEAAREANPLVTDNETAAGNVDESSNAGIGSLQQADAALSALTNADPYTSASYLYQNASMLKFTQNTRGFQAPGIGVIFSSEVSIPLNVIEASIDETDEAGTDLIDDAWEKARQSYQSRKNDSGTDPVPLLNDIPLIGNLFSATEQVELQFDETYVEAIIDEVLDCFGSYASRFTELGDDDCLVIAMRLNSSDALALSRTGSYRAAAAAYYNALSSGAASEPKPQHLVIEISREDARQYRSNNLTLPALRERTKITRY